MVTSNTDIALRTANVAAHAAEPSGRPGYPTPDTGPKILGLGRAVIRHAKLLIATIVILNVLAVIGVRQLTPRYTASADLLVGPREQQVVDLKAVLSGLSGSSDVIESEIQVVRSREIARGVVQTLHLDQTTEFNPSLQGPGLRQFAQDAVLAAWSSLVGQISEQLQRFGFAPLRIGTGNLTERSASNQDESRVTEPLDPLSSPVDRFLGQLDV